MTFVQRLTKTIDRFYLKPFRALMPRQTFRYLACGAVNFAVTTVFYWVAFNFIFAKRNLDLGFLVISPHIAALGVSLPLSFLIGFWMQKNVSFSGSPLKNRTQLFRYFLNALIAALVTYLLDKLFVEDLHIFPTVAFMMIYLITALLGFVLHKHFAFRGADKESPLC